MRRFRSVPAPAAFAACVLAAPLLAQEERKAASLSVAPEEITLTAGGTAQFEVAVLDEDGQEIEDAEVLYLPLYGQFWNLEKRTWGFNIFKVSREGEVSTRRPGGVRHHGAGGRLRPRSVSARFGGQGLHRAARAADDPAAAGGLAHP